MKDNAVIEYGALLCPGCGTDYTSHRRVTTYWREFEDSQDGECVRSSKGELIVRREQFGNPSERRDGVAIDCACEVCGSLFRLYVEQNKGQTLLQTEIMAVRPA